MIESNIPGKFLTKEECIAKYKMRKFITPRGPFYINPKDIKMIKGGYLYMHRSFNEKKEYNDNPPPLKIKIVRK